MIIKTCNMIIKTCLNIIFNAENQEKTCENVAFELAAANEQLNETLRTSFEKQQSENRLGQGLDEGEDMYVFVNQQGKIIS